MVELAPQLLAPETGSNGSNGSNDGFITLLTVSFTFQTEITCGTSYTLQVATPTRYGDIDI